MELEVVMQRAAENRARLGFVTSPGIRNDEAEDNVYFVTQRDLILALLGESLIQWSNLVHAVGDDSAEAIQGEIDLMIKKLHCVRNYVEGRAPENLNKEIEATQRTVMLSKLVLETEELGEAAECAMNGDTHKFWREMADVFIRWTDITGTAAQAGVPIIATIEAVMQRNERREVRHGKKKRT